jgi:hypothetical protein
MVAEEFVTEMFVTRTVKSPYMSFAPQMHAGFAARFPAVRYLRAGADVVGAELLSAL